MSYNKLIQSKTFRNKYIAAQFIRPLKEDGFLAKV